MITQQPEVMKAHLPGCMCRRAAAWRHAAARAIVGMAAVRRILYDRGCLFCEACLPPSSESGASSGTARPVLHAMSWSQGQLLSCDLKHLHPLLHKPSKAISLQAAIEGCCRLPDSRQSSDVGRHLATLGQSLHCDYPGRAAGKREVCWKNGRGWCRSSTNLISGCMMLLMYCSGRLQVVRPTVDADHKPGGGNVAYICILRGAKFFNELLNHQQARILTSQH